MTRKDYQLLAAALYRARPTEASSALEVLQWVSDSLSIADALQADNPRFDRRRFLAACGPGTGGVNRRARATYAITVFAPSRKPKPENRHASAAVCTKSRATLTCISQSCRRA